MAQQNNPQSNSALRLLGARATLTDLVSISPTVLPDAALCWVLDGNQLYFYDRRPVTSADPLDALEVPAGDAAGTLGRWRPVTSGGALSFVQMNRLVGAPHPTMAVTGTFTPVVVPGMSVDSSFDWSTVPNTLAAAYNGQQRGFKVSAGLSCSIASGTIDLELQITTGTVVYQGAGVVGASGPHQVCVDALVALPSGMPPSNTLSIDVRSSSPDVISIHAAYFNISPV